MSDLQPDLPEGCNLCRWGYVHHTNATCSIGGSEGRHKIWDVHVVDGGGLAECTCPAMAEELGLP